MITSIGVKDRKYSIIIPAYNEAGAIGEVLDGIRALNRSEIIEVIVIDDCSTDGTKDKIEPNQAIVLSNIQNFGYGYSLKRGITAAKGSDIIIMDADGSYPVEELPKLISEYEKGFNMVVGARQGSQYHGSLLKRAARLCFRMVSEFTTGRRIPDINSGLRIFNRGLAMSFFNTLSSGFSFTTTITLAYMLNSYSVRYLPIAYRKRAGRSKVKYFRDTLRSAQIIVEAIACYNPLKLFILCSGVIMLSGITLVIVSLLCPMFPALLVFLVIAFSVIAFAIGLIAVFLKFTHGRNVKSL